MIPPTTRIPPPGGFTKSLASAVACAVALKLAPVVAGTIDFQRDIRPILSQNCFFCHGPDAGQRQADLRLDQRGAAVEAGAIVPGDVEHSELLARIDAKDPDTVMPPPGSGKRLTLEQKNLLRAWIESGARYTEHWSFTTIVRPEVPAVRDASWVRNPIDAFILARLEGEGVVPSPVAPPRRLLRRIYLDLIGLPPAWDDVEAMCRQGLSDEAYSDVVERLLASDHYGERMASSWLDVVRYADTVGYHGDQNQRIFPYRDYVIAAFNNNTPFDQFTVEQIAGDLLPNPTPQQRVATGFNRLNMMTREGGAQPKEYLAKYQADRVRTLGMAWLGLTTGCAECHDHKYDPLTTRDFYQLSAFFADIKQWGVYQDYDYTPNPDLAGWSNDHPFPPEIEVQSEYLLREQRRLRARLESSAREAIFARGDTAAGYERWRQATSAWHQRYPGGWGLPHGAELEGEREADARVDDGSWVLSAARGGERATKGPECWTISMGPQEAPIACVRLELLPAHEHGGQLLRGDRRSATVSVSFAICAADGTTRKLAVRRADASAQSYDYANGYAILDVGSRWSLPQEPSKEPLWAVWQLDRAITIAEEERLLTVIQGEGLGRIRITIAPDARLRPLDSGSVETTWEDLQCEEPRGLAAIAYVLGEHPEDAVRAQARLLESRYRECRDGWTWSMVTESVPARVTRVLPRGNWQDETGPEVRPQVPAFLPQIEGHEPSRPATRLDLARWLVARDNPLTARAIVNRLWQRYFGVGLSATLDDLGSQGETPSHRELLDWLAAEFMASGWDIKHMVRLMVLSNTYRQDSRVRRELLDRDPENRWLSYHSPRGLEAEIVRDYALAAAGLIQLEMGGPAVFPYQPPGYYANLQFPDRDYVASEPPQQYRRGVYMHWQRTFLQPMLANFDAPSREECIAQRNRSNTPQQALTLLNDPTFTEAACALAARILRRAGDEESRLRDAFRSALVRDPDAVEASALARFLVARRAEFAADPAAAARLRAAAPHQPVGDLDPVELAAWTATCRVLLNLHETITRY